MSGWKKVKLGEMLLVKKGDYITKKEAKEGKYPVILGGKEPAYFIDKYNHTGKAIVISRSGASAGYVSFWNEPIFVTDGFLIEPKGDVIFEFLYYVLKSKQRELHNTQKGAAIPHVTPALIGDIEGFLPDLQSQQRIVDTLSRYDSLIENCQKQIKLLEEAVQRLYKEWFVELRFPGHENTKMVDGLPEGWERKKLGELVTKSIGGGWGKESPQEKYDKEGFVIRGTDISKLRFGNLDDIPFRYHTESNLKERTLSDGDLIFEVSGGSEKEPVGRMYLITQQILDFYKKDVICASFCKKVAFSNKCTSILCYFAMQYCRISGDMKKFEKDSAGNIINFAWTSFLEDFFVRLPNDEILEAFYKTAIAIINKQVNLSLQIRLLTEARDRLLPRLMGGK